MTPREVLGHPAAALGIGLLVIPVAKLLYVPSYVFNFLTTLVHEIGHSACAMTMGMPSFPAVSVAGGGVAPMGPQLGFLCVLAMILLGSAAWRFRERRPLAAVFAGLTILYPFVAFTKGAELFAIAGGVLFEVVGAAACFHVVLAVHLERPFERPLYALWGWWMPFNRGAETVLMLRSREYWESQAVIESGLAAGLTSDLERIRETLEISPTPVLLVVLLLCLSALPAALLTAWLSRRASL